MAENKQEGGATVNRTQIDTEGKTKQQGPRFISIKDANDGEGPKDSAAKTTEPKVTIPPESQRSRKILIRDKNSDHAADATAVGDASRPASNPNGPPTQPQPVRAEGFVSQAKVEKDTEKMGSMLKMIYDSQLDLMNRVTNLEKALEKNLAGVRNDEPRGDEDRDSRFMKNKEHNFHKVFHFMEQLKVELTSCDEWRKNQNLTTQNLKQKNNALQEKFNEEKKKVEDLQKQLKKYTTKKKKNMQKMSGPTNSTDNLQTMQSGSQQIKQPSGQQQAQQRSQNRHQQQPQGQMQYSTQTRGVDGMSQLSSQNYDMVGQPQGPMQNQPVQMSQQQAQQLQSQQAQQLQSQQAKQQAQQLQSQQAQQLQSQQAQQLQSQQVKQQAQQLQSQQAKQLKNQQQGKQQLPGQPLQAQQAQQQAQKQLATQQQQAQQQQQKMQAAQNQQQVQNQQTAQQQLQHQQQLQNQQAAVAQQQLQNQQAQQMQQQLQQHGLMQSQTAQPASYQQPDQAQAAKNVSASMGLAPHSFDQQQQQQQNPSVMLQPGGFQTQQQQQQQQQAQYANYAAAASGQPHYPSNQNPSGTPGQSVNVGQSSQYMSNQAQGGNPPPMGAAFTGQSMMAPGFQQFGGMGMVQPQQQGLQPQQQGLQQTLPTTQDGRQGPNPSASQSQQHGMQQPSNWP